MKNKSISFTVDILKSVAEKNKIPLELVKYSFDIMLRNLENIVKNSDSTSIFIPEIGTMYANFEYLKAVEKGIKKKGQDSKIITSKLKNIENFIDAIKFKNNYKINRHLQRKFLNNNFFSKGLTVEEIENKQNEAGK